MTRGKLLVGTFVTALAVGGAPAAAQNGKAGASTREPGTSVERTGGAVDRGSAGAGSASSAGTASPSSGSSGSGGWSSPAPSSSGSRSAGTREYATAPVRPSARAERSEGQTRSRGDAGVRQPSGGSGGESNGGSRAVPRDSGDRTAGSARPSAPAAAEAGADSSPSRRAVPTYSRPRGNNEATGTAVNREFPLRGGGGYDLNYRTYYPSLYSRYYWPGYGYGLGLGYYYDPTWYDPFAFGGYGSYYGGGGGYYGGAYQAGSSGSGSYERAATGALRLKLKPRNAQVFVDGFFVGSVDDFDGIFQKLGIDAGGHRIEVKAPGYETAEFDVLITPGETVTYKGDLKPIQ